jgi:hypothetical protein
MDERGLSRLVQRPDLLRASVLPRLVADLLIKRASHRRR